MIYGLINCNYEPGSQKTELVEFGVSSIIYIPDTEKGISELKSFKDGDKVITTCIQNLDLPDSSASDTYQTIFNTGADILILHTPTLSSEIYKNTLIEKTRGTSVKETELIISTVTEILNRQIEIEMKRKDQPEVPIRKTKTKISSEQKVIVTKKEVESKKFIKKNLIDFGGTMTNDEIMNALHLARNSYYKYKRKVNEEIQNAPLTETDPENGL